MAYVASVFQLAEAPAHFARVLDNIEECIQLIRIGIRQLCINSAAQDQITAIKEHMGLLIGQFTAAALRSAGFDNSRCREGNVVARGFMYEPTLRSLFQ